MTVAPSPFLICPTPATVLQWLKTSQQAAYRSDQATIASLCFPIPTVDPLAVLSEAPSGQQCYLDAPTQAIAAWGAVLECRFSGGDRFRKARQCLAIWKRQICRPCPNPGLGPFFFFSFSFFETAPNGVFAPATVLLPSWQVVKQSQQSWVIANVKLGPETALKPLSAALCRQVQHIARVRKPQLGFRTRSKAANPPPLQLTAEAALGLKQSVDQALAVMAQTNLKKQVVAHALDLVSPWPWQRDISLRRLRSRHPDCYTFAFSQGPQTHFIGASPERLLSLRQGKLVADALAGSAPRGSTPLLDRCLGQRLLNNPKEQAEHRFVVDFIVTQLKALGLRPHYDAFPTLLKLSHIQHLHTPIYADLPEHLSPLQLVETLHPTPAVAGVPTAAACNQIQRTERSDRGLYAAPFGWVDYQGNSEFIVGIRSALLQGRRARLYAGAGIVKGSDPDQELAEIQLKLQTLAEVLGNGQRP
ncbi:MAG: isochorismate synthase MenF [Leptolyngbyaceae cyanobacterium]